MSIGELILLLVCSLLSIIFLAEWYYRSYKDTFSIRNNLGQMFLCCVPAVCLAIIYYTLRNLASFDVVGIFIYFYIVMGFSWIYITLWLTFVIFNLSWRDDIFCLNDTASMCAIAGVMVGATLIYSGANIGDGPGWWCVVFAGGLGLTGWFLLGYIIDHVTAVFECITVDRNVSAGIRMCGYLIGSGIILGRASSGDWTSFGQTVVEFLDGWPALILCGFYIGVERYYCNKAKIKYNPKTTPDSIIWGLIFIALSVVTVILLPHPVENPAYESAWKLIN